jgi:hypothetical protein
MVLSMRKTATFLAISLVAAVISLASNGYAASMPTSVVKQPTWGPVPGFGPIIGKVVKDGSDNIYAVDYERRGIVKIWQSGTLLQSSFISTPAALGKPYGLAVMNDGTMVVTFIHPQPKVALLDAAGALLTQQGSFATANFQRPVAVALDSQENIYVLDSGDFKAPTKKSAAGDGYTYIGYDIFVPGTNRACVQVFSKTGAALATGVSATPAWNGTTGYPTNSFGKPSRLQQADAPSTTGTLEPGMFMAPEGLVFDTANKELGVVDTLNGRVQFFGTLDNPTPAKRYALQRSMGNFALESSNEHMTMPVGASIENHVNGPRMYVVDKVLQRIQVFDMATNLSLGIIDGTTFAGASTIYPRDILFYKGSLLIANEQGVETAMLKTLTLDNNVWPPPVLSPFTFNDTAALLLDPNYPNLIVKPAHTFTFTGKVQTGSTVAWSANEGLSGATSGSCSVTNTGSDETWTCNVIFRTVAIDQYVKFVATRGGSTATINEHVSYTTAGSLPYVAPLLTFNAIAPAEQFRKTNTITISGTVDYRTPNPGHTGADLTVKIHNNRTGQRTLAVVDTLASGDVKPWTAIVPLVANMDNTLTPSAYVELSQRGGSTPVSQMVTVDQLAPVIAASALDQGAVTMEQIQNIAGTVDEDNLQSVSVIVNGVESLAMTNVVDAVSHVSYFSALAMLTQNGGNTISVRAVDKAGNETVTDPVTVTLAPMYLPLSGGLLTSTLPADNYFYTSPGVALTFSGTLPTGTTALAIGLDSCTPSGTTYSCPSTRYATLIKKIIPVHISATASGKTVQKMRSLYIDDTRPQVGITSPKEDKAINTNLFTVAGTVNPSTAASGSPISQVFIKVYDSTNTELPALAQTRSVTANAFSSANITLPSEGRYTVQVSATNGVGQTTLASRNLLYETRKPSVGIAIETAPAVLEGYFEAGATIDLKYNGTSVAHNLITFDDSTWSVSTAGMPNLNLVTVIATDPAGNTNSRTYTATVPDADTDGDGVLRVYDAIQTLRLAVSGVTVDSTTMLHTDIAPLVNGKSAPDNLITVDDALAVLMKVEGKPW